MSDEQRRAELARMRALIETYFDGCNQADIEKMVSCFVPDAVHYFPPGMYEGPFVGARKIAEKWAYAVETFGSQWTIDSFIGDAESGRAVIEWTHIKHSQAVVLRGDEWYAFDRTSGLIGEIRAYYASPQSPALSRMELEGFDYVGRGYPAARGVTVRR